VKLLLDRLRSSQAWQESVRPSAVEVNDPLLERRDDEGSSGSVAALLSQLQTLQHPPVPTPPTDQQKQTSTPSTNPDLRSLTSQQALPHLTRLASDPNFVKLINQVRSPTGVVSIVSIGYCPLLIISYS
jgi:hypothetical protein